MVVSTPSEALCWKDLNQYLVQRKPGLCPRNELPPRAEYGLEY